MSIDDLKGRANLLRAQIKDVAADVKQFKDNDVSGTFANIAEGVDSGEAIANLQIAYRKLEDARMRVGKFIQAIDGGVSKYDHETPTRSTPPPEQQQA